VIEVRRDLYGTIDEIVGENFHLERMSDNYLHLVVGDWHVQISTDYHPIVISAESPAQRRVND
jgi:hypothetical protein